MPTVEIISKSKMRTMRLNRPERGNSLDPPTLITLRQAMIDAQRDETVKMICLTGAGAKDFCTGIDVSVAGKLSPENRLNIANLAGDIAMLIYTGKPVIVGLNGRSMGMGVVFATAADYRIITQDAVLRMPEVEGGIFPSAQCVALMTRVCGIAWTRRMLMTGEEFSAEDALSAGIVDELVESVEFEARLRKIAGEMGRKNSILLKAIKYTTNRALDLKYMDVIKLEEKMNSYYAWENPDTKFTELDAEFPQNYKLLGNPDQLLAEYERVKE